MQRLQEFFSNAFSGFGFTDALDILIVAIVVYFVLRMIMETRAQQIVQGILVLVVTMFLSEALDLYVLNWLCKGAVALGAVAILIVFQPELRRALEFMGRGKFVWKISQNDKDKYKKLVTEIVKATDNFSSTKTGALIVFERQTSLEDISETGTILSAIVSEPLLENIFYKGSPLHDGAVVISEGYIYSAGCVLPLTRSREISRGLGTRHRAGIGITENSDAIVLIVSEESGIISIAEDGKLQRFLDLKTVEKRLLDLFLNDTQIEDTLSKIPGARDIFKYKRKESEHQDDYKNNTKRTSGDASDISDSSDDMNKTDGTEDADA